MLPSSPSTGGSGMRVKLELCCNRGAVQQQVRMSCMLTKARSPIPSGFSMHGGRPEGAGEGAAASGAASPARRRRERQLRRGAQTRICRCRMRQTCWRSALVTASYHEATAPRPEQSRRQWSLAALLAAGSACECRAFTERWRDLQARITRQARCIACCRLRRQATAQQQRRTSALGCSSISHNQWNNG